MKLTITVSLLLFTLNVLAAPQKQHEVAAVYFMTNDERGNAIVVHDVLSDGTVKYSRSFSTNGRGANIQRDPPAPDALRSQYSMIVSGNKLYNTNSASNTISMFEINVKQPNQLRMIGKPMHSGGEFPISVAVSSKTGVVCVLNAGSVNGVHCLKPTYKGLVNIPGSTRLLNLPQTTPPTKNDTLYSHSTILFSRDGTKLVIDVKGLVQQKVPGFLAVWDVLPDGSLSKNYKKFPAPSVSAQLNFGMTHLHGKDGYVVTDPTVGGIIYDFSKGYGSESVIKNFKIPGQMTTCWVSYASKSNSYFMTDFGIQAVAEAKIDNNTLNVTTINRFQLPSTTMNIDNVVGTMGRDQYLYQLSPLGTTLFVFDIQPAGRTKLIQSHNYTQSLTNDRVKFTMTGPQGLAFFSKS